MEGIGKMKIFPFTILYLKLFVISIDTECDKGRNWEIIRPLSFVGIYKGVGEYLQPLFEKHKIKATYLISPEVMGDAKSVEILKDIERSGAELGTHLHGEFLEPLSNPNAYKTEEKAEDYDDEVEYQKLKNLTDLFVNVFGFRPTSYRAGRFSITPRTFNFLERLGYKVDSSITPYSFGHLPISPTPYFVKNILEVPITSYTENWGFFKILKASPFYKWRKFRKVASRFGPIWLRPSLFDYKSMLKLVDGLEKRFGEMVLNMFMHNMEVIPGLSPYDAEFTRKNLENIIPAIIDKGYKPGTLHEVYTAYKNANSPFEN